MKTECKYFQSAKYLGFFKRKFQCYQTYHVRIVIENNITRREQIHLGFLQLLWFGHFDQEHYLELHFISLPIDCTRFALDFL